jgi:hypothetical protein
MLAGVMAMVALSGPACARTWAGPVDLSIVDRETGEVLPLWRHHGRQFVAGHPGARYSLRVSNHTGGRVMVVLSVDGVNIVTGETANTNQTGYVFSPYQTYDLTGWRKSDTEVAAFTFAPQSRSYAARTGRPGDVGVIGMAVFREKAAPPPPPPEPSVNRWGEEDDRSRSGDWRSQAPRKAAPPLMEPPPPPPPPSAGASAMAAPAQRAAPASPRGYASTDSALAERRDEKLGTAHGAREWSVIHNVDFERATPYPQFTRQIEYDTYAHLVDAGVIPRPVDPPRHPRPFPANPDGAGYVPDPPEE